MQCAALNNMSLNVRPWRPSTISDRLEHEVASLDKTSK